MAAPYKMAFYHFTGQGGHLAVVKNFKCVEEAKEQQQREAEESQLADYYQAPSHEALVATSPQDQARPAPKQETNTKPAGSYFVAQEAPEWLKSTMPAARMAGERNVALRFLILVIVLVIMAFAVNFAIYTTIAILGKLFGH
uniref:Uncharacterized protein n=1 Tax=Fibrocapsa japonica TaxID=94617 RepID=A0A7S2UXV5_9STRA